jgi:hypothetical protein
MKDVIRTDRMTVMDTDLASAGAHSHGETVKYEVCCSERVLALHAQDNLHGLGVTADQSVDGAEGGDDDWGGVRLWRCPSCWSSIPEVDDCTLTTGVKEGSLNIRSVLTPAMKTTMPLLYLTLVTLCPAHLGATIGLVAMVNKFKLPSKHPAAMQAS